jgi:hypothetical protein
MHRDQRGLPDPALCARPRTADGALRELT